MANDFSKFFARDNTEFTTEFWNRFLKEADNRIKPVEGRLISYDETLTTLKGLTLELLQNAISESLAVVEEQTKLVALMNFFVDGQTRTMGQGSVTFTLDPEEAAQITDAGYVTIVPNGSPSFRMTGPITDLDTETGQITINVVAVDGAGTFEEWFIGVGFIAAGQEGVNFRGAYDAEATYYKHDAVYFAGTRSSYIATADEPAAAPPAAGWALLAEGGTDGEDGTDGSDGIFAEIADQAEAEAGEDNTKGMTPLRVAQALAALVPGLIPPAIPAEIDYDEAVSTSLWSITGLDAFDTIILEFDALKHNGTSSQLLRVDMSDDGLATTRQFEYVAGSVTPNTHPASGVFIILNNKGAVPFVIFSGYGSSTSTVDSIGTTSSNAKELGHLGKGPIDSLSLQFWGDGDITEGNIRLRAL